VVRTFSPQFPDQLFDHPSPQPSGVRSTCFRSKMTRSAWTYNLSHSGQVHTAWSLISPYSNVSCLGALTQLYPFIFVKSYYENTKALYVLPKTSNIRMMRWFSLVPVCSLIVLMNSMGTGYLFNLAFNGICMVLIIVNGCMFFNMVKSSIKTAHICLALTCICICISCPQHMLWSFQFVTTIP
jgi:hypothetical protein